MNNSIIFYNKPKNTHNYIVTLCFGKKYINEWKKFALPNWLIYCKKNNIGLAMINKPIETKKKIIKKTVWHKLLIGEFFVKSKILVNNICYLDNDILINHYIAPNIFNNFDEKKISVVSQVKNLPYDWDYANKVISFNRNKYYSKKYPLDSAIFMKPKDIFKYHNFKNSFNNYFCAGLFIFNVKKNYKFLSSIFYKYPMNFETLTGGGDQPILNYEFQLSNKLNWIDYRFQALWVYEMAYKYSFLYKKINKIDKVVIDCINESLLSNYFLHFAGSWHEGNMWKQEKIIKFFNNKYNIFENYYRLKPRRLPKGRIILK